MAKTEETLPATVEEKKEVLERLHRLKEAIDRSYFEMGGLLYKVHYGKLYKDWEFGSFAEFCETEMGFKERKGQYLISIWKKISVDLGWSSDKLSGVEWSKMKELTSIMNSDNAEELLEEAKSMTVQEVINKVRAEKAAKKAAKAGEGKKTDEDAEPQQRFSLAMFDSQYKTVQEALDVAQSVTQSDKRCHLLEVICLEYLANNAGDMGVVRLQAILDKFQEAFGVSIFLVEDAKVAKEIRVALEG